MPIEGSDKELVMINLHLEAYDDGEGKAKQLAMLMDRMQEEVDKGNYDSYNFEEEELEEDDYYYEDDKE